MTKKSKEEKIREKRDSVPESKIAKLCYQPRTVGGGETRRTEFFIWPRRERAFELLGVGSGTLNRSNKVVRLRSLASCLTSAPFADG